MMSRVGTTAQQGSAPAPRPQVGAESASKAAPAEPRGFDRDDLDIPAFLRRR